MSQVINGRCTNKRKVKKTNSGKKQDQRSKAPPLVSVLQLVNQSISRSVRQSVKKTISQSVSQSGRGALEEPWRSAGGALEEPWKSPRGALEGP